MERWSDGVMEDPASRMNLYHSSNTPLLHHSSSALPVRICRISVSGVFCSHFADYFTGLHSGFKE